MPDLYKPVPTVAPEEGRRTAAIPSIHEEFPHVTLSRAMETALGARGEAMRTLGNSMNTLGESVRSLGKAVDGAGDEIWRRAMGMVELEQEKKANDAIIGYEMSQMDRDEKFKLKEGTAADSEALKAHLTESENARQAIKNTLSPYSQKMFDSNTTRAFIQSARAAATHAATQTRKATVGSIQALIDTTTAQMAKATEDVDFKKGQERVYGLVGQLQHLHGWSNEQTSNEYKRQIEDALAARIKDLALSQPNRAMQMLEENKDSFKDVNKWDQTYQHVKRELDWSGSRHIGDQVESEMPNGTLADKENRARELAERDRSGDQRYREWSVEQTRSKHNLGIAEEADRTRKDHKLLSDSAMGTPGQRPQTWDEYLLIPGVRDALSRHGNDIEDHLRKIVLDNPDRDRYIAPNHEELFHKFRGDLMYEDRQGTVAKIASNPSTIRDLPLLKHEQDELWNIYQHERERMQKSEGQVRVEHGYSVLRSANQLPQTWIRAPSGNKTKIAQFKSIYGEMIEKEMAEKKVLKDEDYKQIGDRALRKTGIKGFFGLGEEERYWQTFQPGHEPKGVQKFDDYKKEYLALPGRSSAGDEEIRRNYIRSRLEKELKDADKGPKKVKTVPVTP